VNSITLPWRFLWRIIRSSFSSIQRENTLRPEENTGLFYSNGLADGQAFCASISLIKVKPLMIKQRLLLYLWCQLSTATISMLPATSAERKMNSSLGVIKFTRFPLPSELGSKGVYDLVRMHPPLEM
jgi:hypothetical protein